MSNLQMSAETAQSIPFALLTSGTRSFYGSDYRHAARMIQAMRHVKGNRYQAKDDQSKVDALAVTIAAYFEADASAGSGVPFSTDHFLAGTQLPPAPSYDGSGVPNGIMLLDSPPEDEGLDEI